MDVYRARSLQRAAAQENDGLSVRLVKCQLSTHCGQNATAYNGGVDALDWFNLLGFGWLYDRVEERYGRGAALLVTIAGAIAIIGVLVSIILIVASLG